MARKLTASLREAPATLPMLAAAALFIIWATDQAGYPVTHWGPGGLVLLILLALAAGVIGLRLGEMPLAVRVALACLAGYTALSFLSTLWADVPGDAWEGANRTLVYLLVFALFACWRQRGASAALALCTWIFAMCGLALFVAVHLDAASAAGVQRLLPGGRLTYPTGYVNAAAALWLLAFWPALLLAGERATPWPLRGPLAAGAVLLGSVALLSQSRGSLYATPIMLVLVFALLPGRARRFALLVPIAAGIGAAAPALLNVGNDLHEGNALPANVHTATAFMLAAALLAGAAVGAAGAIEARRPLSPAAARRARKLVGAVGILVLIGLLAGGWVAAGNPVSRARHAWDTFKSPRGYAANSPGGRLTSGLGSNRYDFYRVALDEFLAHPLLGSGADNFQQQYLAHGRSQETPRYPHSIELRTLAETGLAGAALALVGLAAAVWAGLRACRPVRALRLDPLGAAVAAAAMGGFGYWVVHGSFDWFFEFAGLGAPAFALLGLACALSPRAESAPVAVRVGSRAYRNPGLAAAGVLGTLAAASLAAPWLSGLEIDAALRDWPRAPLVAYARLDDAARLNPLSDQPYVLAGNIALRFGDLARADRAFARALQRVPGDAYALTERGAIASARGQRGTALLLLGRAMRLQPRDELTRAALRAVQSGRRINIEELNEAILRKGQQLG